MLRMGKIKGQQPSNTGLEVELVPSSKQKRRLREQQVIDAEAQQASRGVGERNGLPPMVMGGRSVETGGDGSGWPGGITLDFIYNQLKNRHLLRALLGREPVEGVDCPTEEQMEIAREFYRNRETR